VFEFCLAYIHMSCEHYDVSYSSFAIFKSVLVNTLYINVFYFSRCCCSKLDLVEYCQGVFGWKKTSTFVLEGNSLTTIT